MTLYTFTPNVRRSLGVEIELNLVDSETMAARSGVAEILADVPSELAASVKPEFFQCYVELNTKVCNDVGEVRRDLARKIQVADEITRRHGMRLLWSGTHPFSQWQDQKITPNDRYEKLLESLQETARRIVCFGMHVHVGVDSGDKAIMICDRILRHLPTLLAFSVNSPFWQGRDTGMHSQRTKVMEALPTAGLPPLMRNWSEYVWLLNHMVETGFIQTIRELWWDVRPQPALGTVEVRICDTPPTLEHVLGLTVLIQCLIHDLSEEIDHGTYQFDCHPFLIRQNNWRACRHGMEARLVDAATHEAVPARAVVHRLVERLRPRAAELACVAELESMHDLAEAPTGARRQLEIYRETGDLTEVVRRTLALSESI
jgi:carboxylate-amine ligase